MNTEAIKINIAQRILAVNDNGILEKIAGILDRENIIGYDIEGNPIGEKEYNADIRQALQLLNEGKIKTCTTAELKKSITGK